MAASLDPPAKNVRYLQGRTGWSSKDCRHYLRFYKWVLGPDSSNSLVLTRTLNRSKDVTKERFHRAEMDLDAPRPGNTAPNEHSAMCTVEAKEAWAFLMGRLDEEEQLIVELSAHGVSAREIARQVLATHDDETGSRAKVLRILRKAHKLLRNFELVTQ